MSRPCAPGAEPAYCRGRGLRREAIEHPAAGGAAIAHTVVEPRRLPLPQLDHVGDDAVTAPVGGPRRRRVAELALDALDELLERDPRRDRLRLRRRERAELAAARPRREVRIAVLGRDALDRALDPDLAVERLPEQHERRVRVRGEIAGLAAPVARVERAAAVVELLQQHDARRGPAAL